MKNKPILPPRYDSEASLEKKESKPLSVKQKAVRWVLVALGVYFAGEIVASKLNGDGTQFEITKDGTMCHLDRKQYVGSRIVWTHLKVNERYSWKLWIQDGDPITLAKHSEFHEVTKKSNFNPITGQRYGGNRFRSSDTVTDNASTGAVVNPNNAVLEKCDIERVVNFPWCDSGINPWNLCILTGKTKTEMHNILRLDNLDIDKPSVWWWPNLAWVFSKNRTWDKEVLKKRWEFVYEATVRGELSLADVKNLPAEYQDLGKVKSSIVFLKNQFWEHANGGDIGDWEKERIEFYKQVKILTPEEADGMLKKNEEVLRNKVHVPIPKALQEEITRMLGDTF